MRRGSPLPIPNREVKSDCADGTAVMWESMSPPFLVESLSEKTGFLVFKQSGAVVDSCRRLFFKNPILTDGFFCFIWFRIVSVRDSSAVATLV